MKKIYLAFIAVLLVFTACEDYNDQFEGFDDLGKITAKPVIDMTLTDADYSEMDLDDSYFDAYNVPADLIPDFLANMYPYFDAGSACRVTFNYDLGSITDEANAHVLTDAEYESMGENYHNFSDKDKAESNIMQLLNTNGFFATEGETMTVEYLYFTKNVTRYFRVNANNTTEEVSYSSDAIKLEDADYEAVNRTYHTFNDVADALDLIDDVAANLGSTLPQVYSVVIYKNYFDTYIPFIFDGTSWMVESSIEQRTEQYIFTDANVWVFDPAVSFEMAADDYQLVVDWVKTNKGAEYIDSYGNTEFYSGASAYYKNFDNTVAKLMNLPTDETEARTEIDNRIVETLAGALSLKYPDAVAQVNGVDVMYTITYLTYDRDNSAFSGLTKSVVFQCTGPNTFTHVSGPTVQ